MNYIDPQGTSRLGLVASALCGLYDVYQGYQTSQQIDDINRQIRSLQTQVKGLQSDESCDFGKVDQLNQKINTLQQQLTKLYAKGLAKDTGIGAICGLITKL